MFCFRSDNMRTKSKRFGFIPIISFIIGTFVLPFWYRWHYYTVRRVSRIQNKIVDGWKRARPQVLFHSSCVALECYVPVNCTLMSNTGGCIWNSVIWIHPPTLKVAGSNPPCGRRKKNIYCSELQYWVFISMKYSKIMSNMIEKVNFFSKCFTGIWTIILHITIPHLYHFTICSHIFISNSNFILPK